MNILMIGDVFSSGGRKKLTEELPNIVKEEKIDFIVVNGENVSHGRGISKKHYDFFKDLGVDVITSGNHIFKVKETAEYINSTPDLLKPLNLNKATPGNGTILVTKNNKKIRVTNLQGKTFMDHCDNPYIIFEELLKNDDSDIHIVDFHAEATAEKLAFALNFDGKITALVGTHTHVQTADEQILPLGTAYITDLGMTGCYEGVIGANKDEVIIKERTGMSTRMSPAEGKNQLCGVVISVNENNKAHSVKRVFLKD